MSQYRLETEEDMSSYLDINFGHGVTAVFTNSSGSASTINIIINKWQPHSTESSNYYFRQNNLLGGVIFLYLLFF